MTEVIVFPDTAAIVIAFIKAEFTARSVTAGVGTKTPTPIPPTPFVRIFRTGGLSSQRVLDRVQLTIETTADDTATAHDVAQLVRGLIHSMVGTSQPSTTISGVSSTAISDVQEFTGPQDFPDPLTNSPRYSFTIQVTARGAAA
jgi:hypothetical protein